MRRSNNMDRIRNAFVHAAACCSLAWPCGTAYAEPIYSLTHITRKEGLPQSSVRALAVDSRGFVWLGTEKGIARYDGYRFKEPTSPLNAGVVMKLFVDSRDRVWARWYGKPTTLYDPSLDRWTTIETVHSSSPEFIGDILEANGRIWFTTDDRLYRFDEDTQKLSGVAEIAPEASTRYQQLYAQRLVAFGDAVWAGGRGEVVRVPMNARENPTKIPVHGADIVRLWVHEGTLWLCNAEGAFSLRQAEMQWQLFERAPHPGMTSCLFDAEGATETARIALPSRV